jgi:hypothetical protein
MNGSVNKLTPKLAVNHPIAGTSSRSQSKKRDDSATAQIPRKSSSKTPNRGSNRFGQPKESSSSASGVRRSQS